MTGYRSPHVTCHGPSMAPALRDGDGLVLAPCRGPADLAVGDIIVYPHPFEPYDVAHRVVAVSAEGVSAKGDRNDEPDPDVIPWTSIKGRIVEVVQAANPYAVSPPAAAGKRRPLPRYTRPRLFPISDLSLAHLACMNGNEASGNACVSGPEASGGCKSGAAASAQCGDGAAAGFNCKTGTGN